MTGKRPVMFCLIGNSDGFPMRQKASGRMRSSRKGRSLRDPARARRVRKRTLFYTGDGSAVPFSAADSFPAEAVTQNRPLLSLPFVKKAEAGVYETRKGKNLRRRRKAESGIGASADQEKEKIFAGAGRQEAEIESCFRGSQLFYREQHRKMH